MTADLTKAQELCDNGDFQGAMRQLRPTARQAPLADLAALVRRIAEGAGDQDLATAAAKLAARPEHPQDLFDFGYACVESSVPFLGVPALYEAVRLVPGSRAALNELVSALEREECHSEAADVLEQRDAELEDWPQRYLLAFNAMMAGQVDRAARHFARLSAPDEQWSWAAARLRRMLDRAAVAGSAGPLDSRDLRGWHFALTGGLLTTLSPYGYDQGMTGRWALLGDGFTGCRRGLERLRVVLAAAGVGPESVSLLPGRGDRALGLAAAELLGLPARPYRAGTADTLVVAYRLDGVDAELAQALRERAPGEVLFEHATCWTDPPAVTADVSTLLAQVVNARWEAASWSPQGVDERPAEELAAAICAADPTPDEGDGGTPADPDEALAAFVQAVGAHWLQGSRDRVSSSGPVRSSRFL